MELLVPGNRFSLLLLLLISGIIFYTIRSAVKGKLPFFRKLPAISAIDEAVGRAAELGKPVHVAPGGGELTSSFGPETMVGVSVVNYVAGLAAEKGADLICTIQYTDVQALAEEAVRNGFAAAGRPEAYDPRMVRFSPWGTAYDTTVMGIAERERPGANIAIGAWWHQALYVIEAFSRVGAMSIGGTTRQIMIPFFIGGCDYFLMGEEVMAAGAYISANPVAKGSFLGQDIAKYIAIILIVIGVGAMSLASNIIRQILLW